MWYIWISLLIVYAAITWQSLLEASSPVLRCPQPSTETPYSSLKCFLPAISVGDQISIQLQLFIRPSNKGDENAATGKSRKRASTELPRWISVDTCRIDFVVPSTGLPKLVTSNDGGKLGEASEERNKNVTESDDYRRCEVLLPAISRHRSEIQSEVHPLKARFVILGASPSGETGDAKTHSSNQRIGTMEPFFLTRIQKRESRPIMRRLLNSDSTASSSHQDSTSRHTNRSVVESDQFNNSTMWVPYLKFGREPIRIRFVTEDRSYAFLQRADGYSLTALNSSYYSPMMYVDELSLQQSSQIELAPFEDKKPPVKLRIKISSISPMLDTLYRQIQASFEIIEDNVMFGPELDELKYFLQDENLYRFALTNVISSIHVWLDYLAFRDEVKFYRGRQNLSGVSSTTVTSKMICSLIILLYLIDGGGTSWVVLLSLVSSFAVEVWKAYKLLRPKFIRKYPFLTINQQMSKEEMKTTEYDKIAFRKLSILLYPLLLGWSIYALKTYEYRSVYSWFISNLANGVYMFGFISMCPQLYVNYRLKSVSHMPVRVFCYKIFNTFVDDAFAWLVEMPLKHRLMTLRDDLVFVIFLIQVYLYRVDKNRTNEFGYSYEDENADGKLAIGDNKTNDDCVDGNESITTDCQIGKVKIE